MSRNENMHKAKEAKNDEFYTQLTDIEKELKHYKKHFENKVIFCNCDDPEESNFWKYFNLNFDKLKLKKLITTHYEKEKQSYMLEMYRDENGVHTDIKTLKQNGDFRSPECIELLKEADIVVTNPPFSLFREYVGQLMDYKKKFVIIGNPNAITYKEIFPLLKDNKMWLGYRKSSGGGWFTSTKDFEQAVKKKEKKATWKEVDGVFLVNCPMIWFTNLDITKRHEEVILYKNYNSKDYPEYDNYDAINIDKIKDIPCDYEGVMGVPITFLDNYNPEQFELLDARDFAKNEKQKNKNTYLIKDADSAINSKPKYVRILIRRITK